jgi:hypothetical protein
MKELHGQEEALNIDEVTCLQQLADLRTNVSSLKETLSSVRLSLREVHPNCL